MKFNRELYKNIKKMDRQEMEEFLLYLYDDAYQAGAKKGSAIDTTIHVLERIGKIPGIGVKTMEKIKKGLVEGEQ